MHFDIHTNFRKRRRRPNYVQQEVKVITQNTINVLPLIEACPLPGLTTKLS